MVPGPICWDRNVPPGRSTRAVCAQSVRTGCRLTTRSNEASRKGSGPSGSTATTVAPTRRRVRRATSTLGGQPSVAVSSFGGCGTSASTSPPPVSTSSAAVARAIRSATSRAYPHCGRSSVARPASQSKPHPSIGAAAASAINSSAFRRSVMAVSLTGRPPDRQLICRPPRPRRTGRVRADPSEPLIARPTGPQVGRTRRVGSRAGRRGAGNAGRHAGPATCDRQRGACNAVSAVRVRGAGGRSRRCRWRARRGRPSRCGRCRTGASAGRPGARRCHRRRARPTR